MRSAVRKRASGNTIVEYALGGLLIVCVCIATFNVLGQNLNSIFLRMKNAKNAHGVHSLALGKGFINPKSGNGSGSIMVGLSAQNAGMLQEPLAQRLMTTGANGSTEQLAQYISALVQQKLADGTITQDQANLLIQLANKAHEMASIESMIQTALTNANGSYDAFVAQKFTVNGVTYAADQLTSLLSINQIMTGASSMSDVTSLMNSASNIPPDSSVASFINLFNSAQASGALNDPTISALVNQASTQVTFISDDLTRSIWFNSAGQEGTAFPTPDQVAAREASTATNSQAGTICLAGNGTDTSTSCN